MSLKVAMSELDFEHLSPPLSVRVTLVSEKSLYSKLRDSRIQLNQVILFELGDNLS